MKGTFHKCGRKARTTSTVLLNLPNNTIKSISTPYGEAVDHTDIHFVGEEADNIPQRAGETGAAGPSLGVEYLQKCQFSVIFLINPLTP